jgi:hypothetical protein
MVWSIYVTVPDRDLRQYKLLKGASEMPIRVPYILYNGWQFNFEVLWIT